MLQKKLVMTLVASAALALPAMAQEPSRQDFAVQASGSFVRSTTQNGIQNSANNNAGVLGTYRFFFSNHHGVEANYGYGQDTQSYSGTAGIETHTHEVSGAYVFRMPMHKVTPFALAGVGALVFDPHNFAGAGSQTRAGFVYGAGADVSLTNHVFVRAEYRGFVYNSPTYGLTQLAGLDRVTHRAEPSVGFGYRF
jgi:opacity protein-like surface antigen